jgi:hypothetical protein
MAWVIFPDHHVKHLAVEGLKRTALTTKRAQQLAEFLGRKPRPLIKEMLAMTEPTKGAVLAKLPLSPKGTPLVLLFEARANASAGSLDVIQESDGQVIGGNTIVFRTP